MLEPLHVKRQQRVAELAEAQRREAAEAAKRAEERRIAQEEERRVAGAREAERRQAERDRVAREQRQAQERAERDARAEKDQQRREAARAESERRARSQRRANTAKEVGWTAAGCAVLLVAKFVLSGLLLIVTMGALVGLSFIESGAGVLLMVIVGIGTTLLQWWLWFLWWPD